MRLFPRWHTPEEVAKQLIEGLGHGTLTLTPPAPDATELIEEALRLTADLHATMARLDPKYTAPALPTAEQLARVEQQAPGTVFESLEEWRGIHAQAKALEAEKNRLTRRNFILLGVRLVLFVLPFAWFLYLLWTRPATEFAGYVLAFVAGLAVSAWPLLLSRLRAAVDENARLLAAVAEFVPQAKSAARVRAG